MNQVHPPPQADPSAILHFRVSGAWQPCRVGFNREAGSEVVRKAISRRTGIAPANKIRPTFDAQDSAASGCDIALAAMESVDNPVNFGYVHACVHYNEHEVLLWNLSRSGGSGKLLGGTLVPALLEQGVPIGWRWMTVIIEDGSCSSRGEPTVPLMSRRSEYCR
jgi:hypothetical protein